MKNQKGFIQIPLLIAIITGVLVLGGGSYLGYKKYKNYQSWQIEQQQMVFEKEQKAQSLIDGQRKALEEVKNQIQNLQQQNAESVKKQANLHLQQKNNPQITTDKTISATQLQKYIDEVGRLHCASGNMSGSGFILNAGNKSYIATNAHVLELTRAGIGECFFIYEPKDEWYMYRTIEAQLGDVPKDFSFTISSTTEDFAMLAVGDSAISNKIYPPLASISNNSVTELRNCPKLLPIGSPVYAIGYPSYAKTIEDGVRWRKITTEGIISGYKEVSYDGKTPDDSYTTAKIDAGNSGGLAISRDNYGICLLGIPTWSSEGTYENSGIIQNTNSIFHSN